MPLVRTYVYDSKKCLWEGYRYMCKTMPLIRTYMYYHRENRLWEGYWCMTLGKEPLRGLPCITLGSLLWEGYKHIWEAMPFGRASMHNSRKLPLRGLLMYACAIAFSLWMVVLNQLMSHPLVLYHSFTGLLVDFDNNHHDRGGENGKITWNKLPQFRVSCDSRHEQYVFSETDPFLYIEQGGGNHAK